jgi:hypothetical protein
LLVQSVKFLFNKLRHCNKTGTISCICKCSGKGSSVRKHCGLLQLASAAVQVLRHPKCAKLDSLLAEEKGLLQSIDDEESPSVIKQIIKIVQQQLQLPRNERLMLLL